MDQCLADVDQAPAGEALGHPAEARDTCTDDIGYSLVIGWGRVCYSNPAVATGLDLARGSASLNFVQYPAHDALGTPSKSNTPARAKGQGSRPQKGH